MSSPPDPPDEGPPEVSLSQVRAALTELSAAVAREHERAAHREGIIDRLHEENQVLRRGELQQMHEPVRNALFRLYEIVRRAEKEPPTGDAVAPLLGMIGDELAEALGRTGVERYEVGVGDAFDREVHRPLGTAPVADEKRDGTVVEVNTDGFTRGEQVVRRAQVTVGKFRREG